jgi:hypothetical protein
VDNRKTAVFGIYGGVVQAETAVDALIGAGFFNDDISVLVTDQQNTRDFAHEKHTKAPEVSSAGAATGGVLGGALGLLAGIGIIALPGAGLFVAAGPLMAALAGIGVGGTVGGFVGALVGLGIPEYEAKRYAGRIHDGGVLLSVHCDSPADVERAKEVLKHTSAEDVSSTTEAAVRPVAVASDRRNP